MSASRPRNILYPDDVGVLILLGLPGSMLRLSQKLHDAEIDCSPVQDTNHASWRNEDLWTLMDKPKWRQSLILASSVGNYEVGLVMMGLERGFHVFLASPNLGEIDPRAQRLRQASVVLISLDGAVAELDV